jgi:hypothetical protein
MSLSARTPTANTRRGAKVQTAWDVLASAYVPGQKAVIFQRRSGQIDVLGSLGLLGLVLALPVMACDPTNPTLLLNGGRLISCIILDLARSQSDRKSSE